MEKYDENYKADWIITAASSEANGIAVYNLHGNINDVKQTLVTFAACIKRRTGSREDRIHASDVQ
jgi:hypothetical protein